MEFCRNESVLSISTIQKRQKKKCPPLFYAFLVFLRLPNFKLFGAEMEAKIRFSNFAICGVVLAAMWKQLKDLNFLLSVEFDYCS